MPARILLADQRPGQREAVEAALNATDWQLSVAPDARRALALLAADGAEVAICDPEMPGLDDFELAPQLQRREPALQIVLCIERDDRGRFEMAQRLGAAALIAYPLDPVELAFAMGETQRRIQHHQRTRLLERDLTLAVGEKPIVGASESMIDLLEAMERAAGFKTPVLIRGERGTHREVLARAIHTQSLRRAGPFVAVRCSADTPDSIERQLFDAPRTDGDSRLLAYVRAAQGGTLFLDELSALSPGAQARLLHLLDHEELVSSETGKSHPVDVRVIAATHCDLDVTGSDPNVSAELADRLGAALLSVPPLRERADDIPLLIDHAVARLRAELGVDVEGVSDSAMDRLRHYEWPGNLRELENVVERAMLLAKTDRITLHELPAAIATAVPEGGGGRNGDFSLRRARRSFEAEMIRRALRKTDGNRTRAARLLEISHRALLYKIKEFGLRD